MGVNGHNSPTAHSDMQKANQHLESQGIIPHLEIGASTQNMDKMSTANGTKSDVPAPAPPMPGGLASDASTAQATPAAPSQGDKIAALAKTAADQHQQLWKADPGVPGDLGCASSVSAVLRQGGTNIDQINTKNLGTALKTQGWQTTPNPQPGDVVIGERSSDRSQPGHTGIVGQGGVVYDNNSNTGQFTKDPLSSFNTHEYGAGVTYYAPPGGAGAESPQGALATKADVSSGAGGAAPKAADVGAAAGAPGPVNTFDPSAKADVKAQQLTSMLIDKGLSPAGAAGVVGNYSRETGGTFNPNINQEGGGPGYGLAQWGGDRKTALQSKVNSGSAATQVAFTVDELKGVAGDSERNQALLQELKSTSDPVQAAKDFAVRSERAGEMAMGDRTGAAQAIFDQYQKTQAASGNQAVPTQPFDQVTHLSAPQTTRVSQPDTPAAQFTRAQQDVPAQQMSGSAAQNDASAKMSAPAERSATQSQSGGSSEKQHHHNKKHHHHKKKHHHSGSSSSGSSGSASGLDSGSFGGSSGNSASSSDSTSPILGTTGSTSGQGDGSIITTASTPRNTTGSGQFKLILPAPPSTTDALAQFSPLPNSASMLSDQPAWPMSIQSGNR